MPVMVLSESDVVCHICNVDDAYVLSAAMEACRGVMAWRKWLAEKGSGGPDYEGSMCEEAYRADSGRLDRRALLDRYTQHTANCKACSQVILRCV